MWLIKHVLTLDLADADLSFAKSTIVTGRESAIED